MASRLRLTLSALGTLGLAWVARKGWHLIRARSGWLRVLQPRQRWDQLPRLADSEGLSWLESRRAGSVPFFFQVGDRARYRELLQGWETDALAREAEAVRAGEFRYFHSVSVRAGMPPDWHRNAMTGESAPGDRHWSSIGAYDHGDIKVTWEPARFAAAFVLARAYWRTGDARCPECFWQLVESWRESNPPFAGVHWMCGQEASLRAMAWTFGLYAFLESPATTPARAAALAQMLAATADRVACHIGAATVQQNNHGLSEGAGLWTLGLLLPENARAAHWRELGRRVLESQTEELVDADGGFSQQSFNYERFALHALVWSVRLGDLHGNPLSAALRERTRRMAAFLRTVMDEDTGAVPNYGHNDGSLVLPLSGCDLGDYRPALQGAAAVLDDRRAFDPGPWDEETLWLAGPGPLARRAPTEPVRELRANVGGYYTLRSKEGFLFTRAARFKHRPAHADLLHVDLWWRGLNVAIDPGTFAYNGPCPWNGDLAATALHNTVSIGGVDQMPRAGRFLWANWPRGRCREIGTAGLVLEHDGYERTPTSCRHRRIVVRLPAERWLVLDLLAARTPVSLRLHWLLPDTPREWDGAGGVLLQTGRGSYRVQTGHLGGRGEASLVRGDPAGARGWRSPSYRVRRSALSLALETTAAVAAFWTLLGPAEGPEAFSSLSPAGPGGSWSLSWADGSASVACDSDSATADLILGSETFTEELSR